MGVLTLAALTDMYEMEYSSVYCVCSTFGFSVSLLSMKVFHEGSSAVSDREKLVFDAVWTSNLHTGVCLLLCSATSLIYRPFTFGTP